MAAAALLGTAWSAGARADLFNQRNQIMGERAALMGGAFTALASDISAAYYNPGGLAFAGKHTVSMSGTGYTYVNQRRTETSPSLLVPIDLSISRFNILPTTFGVAFRASKRIVIGASIFELDRFRFDAVSFSQGEITVDRGRGPVTYQEQVLRIRMESQSILGGPFIAWRILDKLAMGISIAYHYFQGGTATSSIRSNAAGDQEQAQEDSEISSGGLVLVFGLLWRPLPRWRLGLTYATETLHTNGSTTFSAGGVNTQGVRLIERGQIGGDVRLPARLSLGVAYERLGSFTLAFDASVYFSLRYPAPRDLLRLSEVDRMHVESPHIDLALGAEYSLTDRWSLRGGLYTNTSGATQQDADLRLNHVGATVGVGYLRNGLSTGMGLNMMVGSAGPQSVPGSSSSVSWRRVQVQLVFGGTARFLK